jgi:hypothetical protein
MATDRRQRRAALLDAVCVAPGALLAIAVDVCWGLVLGLAAAAVAIVARRAWWADHPLAGRIAAGLLTPVVALFLGSLIIDPGNSPLLALLLALPLMGLVEAIALRRGNSFARRFPLTAVALLVVLSTVLGALLLLPRATRFDVTDLPRRAYHPPSPPSWSATALDQAFELVRAVAEQGSSEPEAGLDELSGQTIANGVAVTLFLGDGARRQGLAAGGKSAVDDLRQATVEALASTPWKPGRKRELGTDMEGDWTAASIRLDLLGEQRAIPRRPFLHLFSAGQRALKRFRMLGDLHHLTYEIEPGLDGLIISHGKRKATVLPADPVSEGWLTPKVGSRPGKLRRIVRRVWRREHGAPLDVMDAREVRVGRFRCASFVQHGPGETVVDQQRSGTVGRGTLDRDQVLSALGAAVGWLARQARPDGAYHYETLPPHTIATDDYGIARHAGATYALLSFYRRTADVRELEEVRDLALESALRALSYVARSSKSPAEDRHPGDMCFVREDGSAPSGATALAAIAFALLPEPDRVGDRALRQRIESVSVDERLAGMGSCLLSMIDEVGAVFANYDAAMQNPRVEEERRFFPGEVMLALAHLYRRTGDERYADAARLIGDRQLALNRRSLTLGWPVDGDHWFAQALVELAEATGELRYAELSVLIGRSYLLEQYPPGGGRAPDYRGAYLGVDLPSSNHAACRGEALGAALRGARLLGEDTSPFERGIIEGVRFVISQQMTRQLSYFVPDAFDVEGAFRMDPVNNHCRIDNNQHGIVALLAALETLR